MVYSFSSLFRSIVWTNLQSSGKMPVLKEILMIRARGIEKILLYSFRMFAGILWGSTAFLSLNIWLFFQFHFRWQGLAEVNLIFCFWDSWCKFFRFWYFLINFLNRRTKEFTEFWCNGFTFIKNHINFKAIKFFVIGLFDKFNLL